MAEWGRSAGLLSLDDGALQASVLSRLDLPSMVAVRGTSRRLRGLLPPEAVAARYRALCEEYGSALALLACRLLPLFPYDDRGIPRVAPPFVRAAEGPGGLDESEVRGALEGMPAWPVRLRDRYANRNLAALTAHLGEVCRRLVEAPLLVYRPRGQMEMLAEHDRLVALASFVSRMSGAGWAARAEMCARRMRAILGEVFAAGMPPPGARRFRNEQSMFHPEDLGSETRVVTAVRRVMHDLARLDEGLAASTEAFVRSIFASSEEMRTAGRRVFLHGLVGMGGGGVLASFERYMDRTEQVAAT